MPRKPTGQIIEHQGRDRRTYRALRFRAYGHRHYVALGPVDRQTAEQQLHRIQVDVRRGTWSPQQGRPVSEKVARAAFADAGRELEKSHNALRLAMAALERGRLASDDGTIKAACAASYEELASAERRLVRALGVRHGRPR